jgi:hypothetical protein
VRRRDDLVSKGPHHRGLCARREVHRRRARIGRRGREEGRRQRRPDRAGSAGESLSDIATRAGLTRAAITHYATGQRSADFPAPVARVTSETSLYDWSQVATWLYRHDKLSRDQAIEAAALKAANEAIASGETKLRETLRVRVQEYEAALQRAA